MGNFIEVTFEIDADLKVKFEKVCAENGLTMEEAVILFFEETIRLGQLPFELTEEDKKYLAVQRATSL